jgi:hypothetical protein
VIVARKPFDVRFFGAVQRLVPYEVAVVGCFEQDSFEITKVADAFGNLFHLIVPHGSIIRI